MKFNTDIIVEKVTKEEILKRTTEYDIYSYYMPNKFEVGRVVSSPFRKDPHPSFGIFKSSKTGSLLFKDQATNQVGDCFKLVSIMYDLNFKDTLHRIWNDIIEHNLTVTTQGTTIRDYYKNKKTIISVKRKNFTKADDDYWGQYLVIDRDRLKKFNASPISKFWVNEYISPLVYSNKDPMYAYKVFNSFQVYRPQSELKKNKFRTNCSTYDILGWEQLPDKGDLVVITKSLKDIMVLDYFNIPSVGPVGETTLLPKRAITQLKKRFKRIVLLYDYDNAGIEGSTKMKDEYDIPNVFIPKHLLELYEVKDISDHIKEFGVDKTQILLNEILDEKKQDT